MSFRIYRVVFFEIDDQIESIDIFDRKKIATFYVQNQGVQFKEFLELLPESEPYKEWVKDKLPYIKYYYINQEKERIPLISPEEELIDDIFKKSQIYQESVNNKKWDTICILLSSPKKGKKKRKSEKRNEPDISGMKPTPNKRKFKF